MREWLKEVDRYASPDTCKLLIGNKSDRSDKVVSEAEGVALAKELGMPFLETSARTAENVEAAFIRMAEQLIKMRCVRAVGAVCMCVLSVMGARRARGREGAAAHCVRCAARSASHASLADARSPHPRLPPTPHPRPPQRGEQGGGEEARGGVGRQGLEAQGGRVLLGARALRQRRRGRRGVGY